MTDDTRYVTDEDDLTAWRNAVLSDRGLRESTMELAAILKYSGPEMFDLSKGKGYFSLEILKNFLGVDHHEAKVITRSVGAKYIEEAGQESVQAPWGEASRRAYRLTLPKGGTHE